MHEARNANSVEFGVTSREDVVASGEVTVVASDEYSCFKFLLHE